MDPPAGGRGGKTVNRRKKHTPAGYAQAVKEDLAMHLERWGDARVVDVREVWGDGR